MKPTILKTKYHVHFMSIVLYVLLSDEDKERIKAVYSESINESRTRKRNIFYKSYTIRSFIRVPYSKEMIELLNELLQPWQYDICYLELAKDTYYTDIWDAHKAVLNFRNTFIRKYDSHFMEIDSATYNGKNYSKDSKVIGMHTLYFGKRGTGKAYLAVYTRIEEDMPVMRQEIKITGHGLIKNLTNVNYLPDLLNFDPQKSFDAWFNANMVEADINLENINIFLFGRASHENEWDEMSCSWYLNEKVGDCPAAMRSYLEPLLKDVKKNIRAKRGPRSSYHKKVLTFTINDLVPVRK